MENNIFEKAKSSEPAVYNEEQINKDFMDRLKSHRSGMVIRDRLLYSLTVLVFVFALVEYISPVTAFDFRPEISVYTEASVRLLWSCIIFSVVPAYIVSTGIFFMQSVKKGGEL